jgi:hypothetical protein
VFEAIVNPDYDVTITVGDDGEVTVDQAGIPIMTMWANQWLPTWLGDDALENAIEDGLAALPPKKPAPGPAEALKVPEDGHAGALIPNIGQAHDLIEQAGDTIGTGGPIGWVLQAFAFNKPGQAAGNAAIENAPLIGGVIGKPLLNKVGNTVKPIVQPVGSFLGDKVVKPVGTFFRGLYNKVVRRRACLTGGLLDDAAHFAQRDFSEVFSPFGIRKYSRLAGGTISTIDELADAIRTGAIDPALLEIDVIRRGESTLILNTRAAEALRRAGISRSCWNAVDRTGQSTYESLLDAQLKRNNLGDSGFANPQLRGSQL